MFDILSLPFDKKSCLFFCNQTLSKIWTSPKTLCLLLREQKINISVQGEKKVKNECPSKLKKANIFDMVAFTESEFILFKLKTERKQFVILYIKKKNAFDVYR